MKPPDRGKTGSLAACVLPSFRGHLVGAVVGNFVDTFVSSSVSIFVRTSFLFVDAVVAHVKFFLAGYVATKQVLLMFGEFSWATQWPVSGACHGLSGTLSGASP